MRCSAAKKNRTPFHVSTSSYAQPHFAPSPFHLPPPCLCTPVRTPTLLILDPVVAALSTNRGTTQREKTRRHRTALQGSQRLCVSRWWCCDGRWSHSPNLFFRVPRRHGIPSYTNKFCSNQLLVTGRRTRRSTSSKSISAPCLAREQPPPPLFLATTRDTGYAQRGLAPW